MKAGKSFPAFLISIVSRFSLNCFPEFKLFMRKTLLFAFGILASMSLYAQIKRCNTYESMQDYRAKNRGAETDDQFESWLKQKISARELQGGRTTANYTIPVVFHIVHNGEPVGTGSNLSTARIQQQLNQLNADFANLSGSMYGVATNTDIQFCLAVIGPDGRSLPEPGINRIDRNAKGWTAPPYNGQSSSSYVDQTIMPGTIWNPYAYYNIWTLDLGNTLLGKATFPTSSTLVGLSAGETDTHAGVFVAYQSVGSITSPGAYGTVYGLGRTLTHETGHFLGLRHIWGDTDCGDDYCNDTPAQFEETSGCPTAGTLNDCSPSVPKMFENYMDYTNDNCVNTFTNDQKTRIQAVMLNSPRRKELATAGSCSAPPANSIRFSSAAQTVLETGTGGTCPRYRDVVLAINAYNSANGNATVTFTKTGTATENVDYIITPSSVSFTNGESSKNVTVRIWDDGAVEATKTIVLAYTISGSGVIAASQAQTTTITLVDDDIVPAINNAGTVTLLNETFGTSGNSFPTGWATGSFLSPAGANVWRVSSNGGLGFTGQAAHITNNTTTLVNSYSFTSPSDVVLRSRLINATGYSNIRLSFTYVSSGELFDGVVYDYGTLLYSLGSTPSSFALLNNNATGRPYVFQGVTTATTLSNQLLSSLANSSFHLGFNWVNDESAGSNPGFTIDDVIVTGDAKRIESDLANTGSQNIFAGQEVYITSGNDDQLLARVKNPSGDLGCVTATIQQTGTGTANITTAKGTFLRTQKVITMVPSNNASATHQTTLYFTTAELAAWGADRLNLRILKVQDGVSLNSVLTGANAQVVTPIAVEENVAGGYVAYTGNFTGFSQFMLVSPTFTLPVSLVTFDAQPARKAIELSWKTAAERNSKGFHIERSTNGTDFLSIGWVGGAGTTNEASFYRFTDRFVQPNTVYYYRLNQVDFDNQSTRSTTKQAKIVADGIAVTVSPNPASTQLKVFVAGLAQPVDVSLFDVKGQQVGRWSKVNLSSPYSINVHRFAKGQYTLVVHLPEGDVNEKVIIQ